MKRQSQPFRKRSQSGVAAVEMAASVAFLVILLAYPVYIGRVMFHYTVAAKTAHDVARYMSTVAPTDFATDAQIANVIAVGQAIAAEELADLNTGGDAPSVSILCDDAPCSHLTVPKAVRANVEMRVYDNLFYGLTSPVSGDDGIYLKSSVVVAYAGQ